VTSLKRYIAEEIATDHVDGLLTRREAIRRLALLGMGGAAAGELISACTNQQKPVESQPTTVPESSTGPGHPPGMGKILASAPVLVIHENKGLNDWVRSVAGRLAGAGHSALAVDLLSEEGGTGAFQDPAEATAALSKIPPERSTRDLNSGVAELRLRTPGQKVGVVGFCFGGGLVWQLLGSGALGVSAAVPF
jgi:carboxymethylenebutenolidase